MSVDIKIPLSKGVKYVLVTTFEIWTKMFWGHSWKRRQLLEIETESKFQTVVRRGKCYLGFEQKNVWNTQSWRDSEKTVAWDCNRKRLKP